MRILGLPLPGGPYFLGVALFAQPGFQQATISGSSENVRESTQESDLSLGGLACLPQNCPLRSLKTRRLKTKHNDIPPDILSE